MPTAIHVQVSATDNNDASHVMPSVKTTTTAKPMLSTVNSENKKRSLAPKPKHDNSQKKKAKAPSSIKKYFATISSTPTNAKKNKKSTATQIKKKNDKVATPSLSKTPKKKSTDKSSSSTTPKKKKKSPSLLEELKPLLNSGTKNKKKVSAKSKDKTPSKSAKKSVMKSSKDKKKDKIKILKSPKPKETKDLTEKENKKKTTPKKVTPLSSLDGSETMFSSQESNNKLSGSAITCIEEIESADQCIPSLLIPKKKPKENRKSLSKRVTYKDMILHALLECKDYKNGLTIEGLCKLLPKYFPKQLKDSKIQSSLRASIRVAINTTIKNNENVIIQVQTRKSYKLTAQGRKLMKDRKKTIEREKKKMEKEKMKKIQEKLKKKLLIEAKKRKIEEEKEAKKKAKEEMEMKRKKEIEHKKQQEAEKKRLLLISKRKFPMDDIKLIQEDKELKIPYPPKSVHPRPNLPLLVDVFDFSAKDTKTHDLIYDSLQIYQILQGDIGGAAFAQSSSSDSNTMPKFSLVEWFTCIAKLNTKQGGKSLPLPPLIADIFYHVVKEILSRKTSSSNKSNNKESATKRLYNSLEKLHSVLHPYSWPYVCYEYMKVMDKYLKCSELDGLWIYEKEDYLAYGPPPTEYIDGYLGLKDGLLYKAHAKLATNDILRNNASSLSCSEIIILLKVLCDDLVSNMEDYLNKVKEERNNLDRNCKQCEITYKRVKAGYEAAQKADEKQDEEKKSSNDSDNKMDIDTTDKNKSIKDSDHEAKDKTESDEQNIKEVDVTNGNEKSSEVVEAKEKESASKKHQFYSQEEYDQAKLARDKAVEAHETACRIMITNTEPIGQDRNFRSYYSFPYDPTLILVEDNDNPELFTLITCRSKLDALLSSLDVRGIREHKLHSQLSALRKGLYNDIKTEQEASRKRKKETEKEDLIDKLKLLENESNDENIRRSSRATELEIEKIKRQIADVEITLEEFKNEGSRSFLNVKTRSKSSLNSFCSSSDSVTNYNEMKSFFVDELIDLESLWTDDLCMSLDDVDETFDKKKWKANLTNKNKMKNHQTCLETLKQCLLTLEEYVHKSTNIDILFEGYSTLDSDILQKHGTEASAVNKSKEEDDNSHDDDSSTSTSNETQEESSAKDEHFLTEEASTLILQRCAALTLHLFSAAEDGEGESEIGYNPLEILDQRSDWISLVRSCNTFSMFAIILQSLKKDIKCLVNLLEPKQEILFDSLKKSKSRNKKIKAEINPCSKLWTPVRISNNFVWIQWRQPFKQMISLPARICEPLNSDIAKLLEKLNVNMYAPIGEDINSYCISKDDILVFHPKKYDEKVKLNKHCEYWTQCMEIATSLYETEKNI